MAIQTPSLELGAPLVQPTAAAAGRGYWKSSSAACGAIR